VIETFIKLVLNYVIFLKTSSLTKSKFLQVIYDKSFQFK